MLEENSRCQKRERERETQHRNTEKLCRQPRGLRAAAATGGTLWKQRMPLAAMPGGGTAQGTHTLMPQHEAIGSSFPGTFHMPPLLHSVLSPGMQTPPKAEGVFILIYSPLSYTALDRNHLRVVQSSGV